MNEPEINEIIAEAVGGSSGPGRLVAFGEAYIVLESGSRDRFEHANSASISVGGPELNTAAAYACLDYQADWVSTVADSPFGRRSLRAAREANVGTHYVQLAEGRTGIKFVERGVDPRNSTVVLDTERSAFAGKPSGRYDWESILAGASAFSFSGSALAVSPAARQDAIAAMTTASDMGLIVAFDLGDPPDHWSEAEARNTISGIVRHTDVLFATRQNLELYFGIEGAYDVVMRSAIEKLGVAAVAMVRERSRGNGRITLEGLAMGKNGSMAMSTSHIVDVVDAGGSSDAFAAGFLAGYLTDPAAITRAISLGAAMGALVQTMPGELLIATRDEIEVLANAG